MMPASGSAQITDKQVLILYHATGAQAWVGYLNSIFAANLIGHFDKKAKIQAIEDYVADDLTPYDAIFYLGTDEMPHTLPAAFLYDVLHTRKSVVWFKYNLEQLENFSPDFVTHFGFSYDPYNRSEYDAILYKNTLLAKNNLDNSMGHLTIYNSEKALVLALAQNHRTQQKTPYITHSDHLWYIADIPFSYISENDRYLAFADILYDILKQPFITQRRAILRLEDIDPSYDLQILKEIADYLYQEHVPFAISLIPVHRDPLGVYTQLIPYELQITDNPSFITILQYMISKGGTLILHGYSHQYGEGPNPFSGTSADDYEFYQVSYDAHTGVSSLLSPVIEDSQAWVADRIQKAKTLLDKANLSATVWETPHYTASMLDSQYFAEAFDATIGRIMYFDPYNQKHYASQLFPYVIQHDVYGQKVLPENIGCVSPHTWFNFSTRTVDDLILSAQKNLVVRDAWASMYYHPYLGLSYLQQLIPAIKNLGYQFVHVSAELA